MTEVQILSGEADEKIKKFMDQAMPSKMIVFCKWHNWKSSKNAETCPACKGTTHVC